MEIFKSDFFPTMYVDIMLSIIPPSLYYTFPTSTDLL